MSRTSKLSLTAVAILSTTFLIPCDASAAGRGFAHAAMSARSFHGGGGGVRSAGVHAMRPHFAAHSVRTGGMRTGGMRTGSGAANRFHFAANGGSRPPARANFGFGNAHSLATSSKIGAAGKTPAFPHPLAPPTKSFGSTFKPSFGGSTFGKIPVQNGLQGKIASLGKQAGVPQLAFILTTRLGLFRSTRPSLAATTRLVATTRPAARPAITTRPAARPIPLPAATTRLAARPIPLPAATRLAARPRPLRAATRPGRKRKIRRSSPRSRTSFRFVRSSSSIRDLGRTATDPSAVAVFRSDPEALRSRALADSRSVTEAVLRRSVAVVVTFRPAPEAPSRRSPPVRRRRQ